MGNCDGDGEIEEDMASDASSQLLYPLPSTMNAAILFVRRPNRVGVARWKSPLVGK